jgi:hypothetical protein
MEEETIKNELNAPHQINLPMKKIRINEVTNVIKHKIHPQKGPRLRPDHRKSPSGPFPKRPQSDNTNI